MGASVCDRHQLESRLCRQRCVSALLNNALYRLLRGWVHRDCSRDVVPDLLEQTRQSVSKSLGRVERRVGDYFGQRKTTQSTT